MAVLVVAKELSITVVWRRVSTYPRARSAWVRARRLIKVIQVRSRGLFWLEAVGQVRALWHLSSVTRSFSSWLYLRMTRVSLPGTRAIYNHRVPAKPRRTCSPHRKVNPRVPSCLPAQPALGPAELA